MIASLVRWLLYRGNRPFKWLWWSQTVSMVGSQVSLVAIPLLAAISLRADAFEMGLLVAVETVAYLLISVPAGILADRVDRRRLLIVSNLGRAAFLVVIPAGAVLGSLSLSLLYAVSSGVGVFSAIFDVTYQSYVPELLEPGELLDGNQRIELSESAARTLGPGLAGSLIAAFGGVVAVTVDALSYLVASLALLGAARGDRASGSHPQGDEGMAKGASRPDLPAREEGGMWTGFKIVLLDRVLRDMAISTGIFNLASSAIVAVFFLFAARDLGMEPTSIGLLLGLSNVGFVVGALTVGAVTTRLGIGWTLTVAAVLGAVATVILPFATGPSAIVFLFAGRFVGALAIPFFNVNARAFRQSRSPLVALGRVSAVFRLVDWGTLPIGAILGGWIGTEYGLRTTLAVGSLLGIASAAWLIASPVRHVRGLEPTPDRPRSPFLTAGTGGRRAAGLAVRIVAMAGEGAARLGELSFHWTSLAVAGFALQLALFLPRVNVFGAATPLLYVVSCLAVLACVIRNVRIPGLAIIALGGASNLLAIVVNGGFMPVAAEAARAAGQLPPDGYLTTIETASPALKPLTDVLVVAWPLPLANVYSVGDVFVLVGLFGTLVWMLRQPSTVHRADGSTGGGRLIVESTPTVHVGT